MNEQTFLFLVVVVETRFDACQNIVWLKTYHVVQESAEFINFAFHFDQGSSIFLNEIDVRVDLVLEVFILHVKLIDHMLLLQYLEEFLAIIECIEIFNPVINISLEAFKFIKSLISKVLWGWSVVLDALQVADDLLGI